MAPAQRLVAARSRTTPTAHEYWVRDRRHDRPRQLRVAARPPTNDRIARETGRSSSANRHRSQRRAPDKVCGPGGQIRAASAAFPCLDKAKAQRRAEILSTVLSKTLKLTTTWKLSRK